MKYEIILLIVIILTLILLKLKLYNNLKYGEHFTIYDNNQDIKIPENIMDIDFNKPKMPVIDNTEIDNSSKLGIIHVDKSTMNLNISQNDQICANNKECIMRRQYYKNPQNMNNKQKEKFKYYSKFSNMNITDYKNWLLLFAEDNDLSKLSQRHINNYIKIKKGEELKSCDIPLDIVKPPLNSSDYFKLLYNNGDGTKSKIGFYEPQNNTFSGSLIPANSVDFIPFENSQSLKHLVSDDNNICNKYIKYKHNEDLQKVIPKIEHNWNYSTGSELHN